MTWNWQQSDWPHFTWNQGRLATAENEFLLGSGVFLGASSIWAMTIEISSRSKR